uniref:Nucleolar protein 8 n=1 Tax=Steinernema glaseri TaxID=37863 RepID=A0A1I7Y5X3_9BILA
MDQSSLHCKSVFLFVYIQFGKSKTVIADEFSTNIPMDEKAEKRAKSDARRVDSLYEKRKLEQARKNQISQALKNVDGKSNRTVFEDSDNEENIVLNTVQSSIAKPPEEANTSKKSQWTLFEDSDAETDDKEEVDLQIKNRHVGQKGVKLMALEARFGNDERFRMDERFAEDSDEEPSEEQRENQERLHAKKTELDILSKVMGKTLTSKLSDEKRKTEKKMRDMRFTRFDPDNPEHMQWAHQKQVERYGETKEEEDAPPKKVAKTEVVPERVVEGRYFEMDNEFAADLKSKLQLQNSEEGTSFSFLSSIGRAAPINKTSSEDGIDNSDKKELPESVESFLDHASEEPKPATSAEKELLATESSFSLVRPKDRKPWFSFEDCDNDVRSTVNNFRRTMAEDKLRANWQNIRTSIIKIYRSQKKSAVKEDRKRKRPTDGPTAMADEASV